MAQGCNIAIATIYRTMDEAILILEAGLRLFTGNDFQ
jgi:hypothetical protein